VFFPPNICQAFLYFFLLLRVVVFSLIYCPYVASLAGQSFPSEKCPPTFRYSTPSLRISYRRSLSAAKAKRASPSNQSSQIVCCVRVSSADTIRDPCSIRHGIPFRPQRHPDPGPLVLGTPHPMALPPEDARGLPSVRPRALLHWGHSRFVRVTLPSRLVPPIRSCSGKTITRDLSSSFLS